MALIKNKIFIGRIILSGICLLFLATTFHTENRSSGWYQQFLPNLNGRSVKDVFFLDSLTGWGVTNATNQQYDTIYILKTTNSGDNWTIQYNNLLTGGGFWGYTKIYFLNQYTGFAGDITGISKSTNGGTNWFYLFPQYNFVVSDMSVLNQDTIWIVGSTGFYDAVLRTTNGGISWQEQYSWGSLQSAKIYMYNARIGYICNDIYLSDIRKTTDGGTSWSVIVPNEGFRDIFFIDSLTGWYAWSVDSIKKTTNGGITWFKQLLPHSQQIGESGIFKFSFLNKDTIWAVGAIKYYTPTPLEVRGVIYISTNGGNNWGYQLPDPYQINVNRYYYISFINKLNGWAYTMTNKGVHTVTGGDTTFYTGIQKISNEIPKDYILYQNYPNPFNPRTVIGYEIKKNSFVKLDVFDILGKEAGVLVNEKQSAGKYEVDFMGKFSPSGIYFYRLMVDGKIIDTKKMLLVK